MERIVVLKWDKIALVVPEREDVLPWYKFINDIENQIFLDQRWRLTYLEAEYDYYDKLKTQDDKKVFSIMVLETQKIIWSVSLFRISEKNHHATLWILLWDKDEQNRWFWTETISLILKYWFEVLCLHKIKLEALETNARARRVYEKCWFKEYWRAREEHFDWDKYFDTICMEILRKEYFSNLDN